MTCINTSVQTPQDPFALASTRKQSSCQNNVYFYAFLFLSFPAMTRCATSISWILDEISTKGCILCWTGTYWLFSQHIDWSSLLNQPGMASERTFLTTVSVVTAFPDKPSQAIKIAHYLIHCLVSSASPKCLDLKEWFILSWGVLL